MQKITTLKNGNLKIQTINEEPSLTQQQYAKSSDINEIMRQYEKTGELAQHFAQNGVYADISTLPDYQQALNTIQHADTAFMALSADIRKRFENNPAEMISFLQDKQNREEAIKLGLIIPPPTNEQTQINEPKQPTEPKK